MNLFVTDREDVADILLKNNIGPVLIVNARTGNLEEIYAERTIWVEYEFPQPFFNTDHRHVGWVSDDGPYPHRAAEEILADVKWNLKWRSKNPEYKK